MSGEDTLDSLLVGGDSGTFNPDIVLLNRMSCINCNLVIGSVTVFNSEIVILDINVQKWQDKLFFDRIPDYSGLFVSIELNDRVVDLNFLLTCKSKGLAKKFPPKIAADQPDMTLLANVE